MKSIDVNCSNRNACVKNFYTDLTNLAENDLLPHFYGREEILETIIDNLNRMVKGNVLLVGEPGVGKTSIVEGLAIRIVEGSVPFSLLGSKIFSLDVPGIIAGSRYRGDLEDRLNSVIRSILEHKSGILFIDEFHTIIKTGGNFGLNIADILKPVLARSGFRCLGATTDTEFSKMLSNSDNALMRRFVQINVPEMNCKETFELLMNVKETFEKNHKVYFRKCDLRKCIDLINVFLRNRKFPDKAIDVIDSVGACLSRVEIPDNVVKMYNKISLLRSKKRKFVSDQNFEKAIKTRDKISKIKEVVGYKLDDHYNEVYKIVEDDDIVKIVSKLSGFSENLLLEYSSNFCCLENETRNVNIRTDNEMLSKCIPKVLSNFHNFEVRKRIVGIFLFIKTSDSDIQNFAKSLSDFLYCDARSYEYISFENHYVSCYCDEESNSFEGFCDIGEIVKKKRSTVIVIDGIDEASEKVLDRIYKIISKGEVNSLNGEIVSCKECIFIFGIKNNKKDSKSIIGFFHNEENKHDFELIYIFNSKCSAIMKKIIDSCDEVLNNVNKNNDCKQDIRTSTSKKITDILNSLTNYGYYVRIDDNSLDRLVSLYTSSKFDLSDFTYNKIVGPLIKKFSNSKTFDNKIKVNISVENKKIKMFEGFNAVD